MIYGMDVEGTQEGRDEHHQITKSYGFDATEQTQQVKTRQTYDYTCPEITRRLFPHKKA